MTPEQRKMVASHVADTVATQPWGAAIRACLAAADRASDPQAEADRLLGAAVRELGAEAFDNAAEAIDDDGAMFHDLSWVPKFRAIAAALREEAGR